MHDLHIKTVHVHMIGLILHTGAILMRPGFSLFYRRDRARPNEPIHLRERSYASRDSQGINNLLHPKMFLEVLQATLA